MKILQEFREFAVKGNVIDLAVGVIIGGAFGKIVTSLVNDIIMPPIGYLLGEIDFKDLKLPLGTATDTSSEITYISYGAFINTVLDFLIVALCIFFMVKGINQLRRITEKEKEKEKEEVAAAPTEKECPHCLSQVPIKATRCKYCTSELKATSSNA